MLNLSIKNEASEDRDQSGSSISWPSTSMPTRFVRQFGLDVGL